MKEIYTVLKITFKNKCEEQIKRNKGSPDKHYQKTQNRVGPCLKGKFTDFYLAANGSSLGSRCTVYEWY